MRRVAFGMVGVQAAMVIAFAALAFSGYITLGGFEPATEPGARSAAVTRVDRFDAPRAFADLRSQVALGPRPAGSAASRRLAARLRRELPNGRYEAVPGGLRNVVGTVPGRVPGRVVVVGAHYDTKDIPGFVGANDGAGGTAMLVELARGLRPHSIGPTVVFVAFDGEESPRGAADSEFEDKGLRGAKVSARSLAGAEAMILLDFVADRDLAIPREANSNEALWEKLRASAARVGAERAFPPGSSAAVSDDHLPFQAAGVPAIDLIDFDFSCWHRRCDDMTAVSAQSLDLAGEAVAELVRTL